MEFHSWKVNFKTGVCAKTANPRITVHWITEVEEANSIDELMTSQSILGRRFPRQRDAGCNDGVCIEEASHLACALPKESKC